jgi:hypothetical protein
MRHFVADISDVEPLKQEDKAKRVELVSVVLRGKYEMCTDSFMSRRILFMIYKRQPRGWNSSPDRGRIFFPPLHVVPTDSGAHPAS